MFDRTFWLFASRRLVAAMLLLVGVTLIGFALVNLVPGDPVAAQLGEVAARDPAAVDAFKRRHGLDQSLPVQYWTFATNLLQGDMGVSIRTGRPVARDLAQFVPATFELAIVAIVIGLATGIALGTLAAVFRERWIDQVLRVASLVGVSMPIFWLALLAFFVFSFQLGIFPGVGRLDPGFPPPEYVTGMFTVDALLAGDWVTFRSALSHALLPALVLAAQIVSLLTRFTRSAVLEVLGNDYVRTAHSKGLPGFIVVTRHVLRAALVPVITVAGVMFGTVLSGTVLVEAIFSWPGLGQYVLTSAVNLDLPAIVGASLFVAVVYVTINFAVDVLYGVIDPRIRLG